MLCFEIELNGKPLCRSGIGAYGVLTASTTWVRRDPARQTPDGSSTQLCEELSLDISGMSQTAHLRWPSPDLKRGNVVTIRILDSDDPDKPANVQPIDKEFEARAEREYYEKLKRRYEPNG